MQHLLIVFQKKSSVEEEIEVFDSLQQLEDDFLNKCGTKRHCHEMDDREEAMYFFEDL